MSTEALTGLKEEIIQQRSIYFSLCLAEFSNYVELCTFEYTWSTAEEGTSSPVHHLCVPPPIWVLFLFSFFFLTQLAAILMKVMGGSQP